MLLSPTPGARASNEYLNYLTLPMQTQLSNHVNARASNEYLGSLLYISFLFIAFFVMLNMFLAIIAKTYDDVNSKEEDEDPMAYEFRYQRACVCLYTGGLGCRVGASCVCVCVCVCLSV